MSTTTEKGEEFISHHGVKGQKWGVRRDRNKAGFFERQAAKGEARIRARRPEVHARAADTIGGSRRTHTRIKTRGGEDSPASSEALTTAKVNQKLKKSGMHALSNKELQDAIERMRLEVQIKELQKKRPKSRRKEFIDALLDDPNARK